MDERSPLARPHPELPDRPTDNQTSPTRQREPSLSPCRLTYVSTNLLPEFRATKADFDDFGDNKSECSGRRATPTSSQFMEATSPTRRMSRRPLSTRSATIFSATDSQFWIRRVRMASRGLRKGAERLVGLVITRSGTVSRFSSSTRDREMRRPKLIRIVADFSGHIDSHTVRSIILLSSDAAQSRSGSAVAFRVAPPILTFTLQEQGWSNQIARIYLNSLLTFDLTTYTYRNISSVGSSLETNSSSC